MQAVPYVYAVIAFGLAVLGIALLAGLMLVDRDSRRRGEWEFRLPAAITAGVAFAALAGVAVDLRVGRQGASGFDSLPWAASVLGSGPSAAAVFAAVPVLGGIVLSLRRGRLGGLMAAAAVAAVGVATTLAQAPVPSEPFTLATGVALLVGVVALGAMLAFGTSRHLMVAGYTIALCAVAVLVTMPVPGAPSYWPRAVPFVLLAVGVVAAAVGAVVVSARSRPADDRTSWLRHRRMAWLVAVASGVAVLAMLAFRRGPDFGLIFAVAALLFVLGYVVASILRFFVPGLAGLAGPTARDDRSGEGDAAA